MRLTGSLSFLRLSWLCWCSSWEGETPPWHWDLYRQRTCLHSDFEHLFSISLLRRRALHLHDTEVWINGCRSWSLHRPQAQAYWMLAILSWCYLFSATENWVTYLVAGAGPLGSLFSDFQYPPALHSFPFSVIYAYWFEACKVRVSDLWLFSVLQHQGSLVWSHKISFKMAPSPSLQVTQSDKMGFLTWLTHSSEKWLSH